MRYRRFGKTDLNLSIFTLGTQNLAFPESDRNRERKTEQAVQAIRRAFSLGVNHIDVDHCAHNAECLVGLALQQTETPEVHISLQVPICDSADSMKATLETALKRLGRESIDVLTLRGVNTPQCLNQVTSPTGCMKAVEEAQEQGLIRHLGVSTIGPVEFVLKALNTELFDSLHIHYSYFYQRSHQIIDKAAEMDIGVLVISPNERGGSLHQPTPILEECCDPLHPILVNHRFILQHSGVTSIRLGLQQPQEFDLHESVFDNDGALSDAETLSLARLDVRRLQLPDSWCTHCHDCLPCPENINIPEVLRLRNMALAYDMVDHARSQYSQLGASEEDSWVHGEPGNRCTECGDCLPRCPERLEIPKLLQEADELCRPNGKRRTVKANQANA